MDSKKLFIITGELSGDIHASNVVKELKKINSSIEIEAIGGDNLNAEGVKLFSNHKKMGSVGISLKIIKDHLSLGKRLVDYLINDYKPDMVLLIDYGAFNLNVAKFLKKAGIKVFYYIPPQIWASRKWRIKKIKQYVDKVLCIFPFEKEMYESENIDVHYCGHPLISQIQPKADRDEFFEKYGLDKNKKLVSIFPGSRIFELKNLMKTFIKSTEKLRKNHTDLQFAFSQAPNISDETYKNFIKNADFKIIKGDNQALLSVSDALILASGTVALEAALYQTPMIIAYKGPKLFYLIYLLVRCIKKVSLPNIITNKDIVPELIQNKLSVKNIVSNIENLLYNQTARENHIKDLSEVGKILSDKISSKEVAEIINNNIS